MVEIKEVKTNRDLKEFVKFPFTLYSKNKNWVPPLIMDEMSTLRRDRNPAFEYCEARYWLAYKDGKVVGRIGGIISHRYIERWNRKNARFGWIDFIDDENVSKALLETVENWAKEKGLSGVHGPLGFCDMDKEGMLVEGFDEPGMMITIYNYPYYPEHMKKWGYEKDVDWVEYELHSPSKMPEKIERISQAAMKRLKLKILEAKKAKKLLPYAKEMFALINEAYKDLYGVVALTDKQVEVYTKQYLGFVNPDYVRVILDNNGKMAGFGIAMPSLSKALKKSGGKLFPWGFVHILKALKKNKYLDLYLVAVRPDLQGKGVNAVILTEIIRKGMENGIISAETGPELELNTKVQELWKYVDARQHKRRRCFIKYFDF